MAQLPKSLPPCMPHLRARFHHLRAVVATSLLLMAGCGGSVTATDDAGPAAREDNRSPAEVVDSGTVARDSDARSARDSRVQCPHDNPTPGADAGDSRDGAVLTVWVINKQTTGAGGIGSSDELQSKQAEQPQGTFRHARLNFASFCSWNRIFLHYPVPCSDCGDAGVQLAEERLTGPDCNDGSAYSYDVPNMGAPIDPATLRVSTMPTHGPYCEWTTLLKNIEFWD